MKTQTLVMPSHMFIPATANLSDQYLSVLAVGSLRLDACAILEAEDWQRTVGTDYFIKRLSSGSSLLIYDLAGATHLTTMLEQLGKKASIVLFFGNQSEKFEDELKRLGLSEGKTYDLADVPGMALVNNDNYSEKLMTFLNEIVSHPEALSGPVHPRHEDKLKNKGCQIL